MTTFMDLMQQPVAAPLPIVPVLGGTPFNTWQAAVNAPETRQTLVNEEQPEPGIDPMRAVRAAAHERQAEIRARVNQQLVPKPATKEN